MADTPILNYKGKYDGPEIDKAVELALGLENPKSCPYYVHISLSKPDYVLTIGLGDAEGNLFNHAEIDLPLESMVVNATYENGNIILHLQDGTSTEPIPISALIAGLVSENRTIAGIDLKDNITQKELRDALDMYTKDSVDQLVSDLENRIDETLNDLSDLTSEHDTQIKKNTSDIAVNRTTLGVQSKNLIASVLKSQTTSGITVTVNDDKSITFNGTATKSLFFTIGYFTPPDIRRYALSGCPDGGSNKTYQLYISDTNAYNAGPLTYDTRFTPTNTDRLTVSIVIYMNAVCDNLTFYPMVRDANITDRTYEPYVPSVNERLVEVEESVSELTPQVEQNKSDILSNAETIERIGLKTGSSAAVHLSAVGWYRAFVAERKQTVRSGILMINRAFNTAAPESYTILFNLAHSNSIFRLLSKNIEGQGITKIRLVYSSTTPQLSPCYIDIYYNSTSGNTMTTSVYCESIAATGAGSTFANSRFVVSDFSVAEIPEGYKSVEFDLTGKDVFERLTALETALTQTTE